MPSFVLKLMLGVVFFHCYASVQSNNIGTPFTVNYSNQIYQAGTQNWNVKQHPNGFVYFANSDGVLQYDGTNWQTYPLPNKTIARSLHITDDGKIYVGGQGEIGYFEADDKGKLIFYSLLAHIPEEHRQFADVWKIIEWKDKIYILASSRVYVFHQQQVQLITKDKIRAIEKVANRFFFSTIQETFELIDDEIVPIKNFSGQEKMLLKGSISINGRIIFSTLRHGFFELQSDTLVPIYTSLLKFWKKNRIYCITPLNNHQIAIGTSYSGIVVFDIETQKIQHHIDRQNGLQNNNVLSIFKDKSQNLWLGLENGIDYMLTNSPFTKVIPDNELEGTAYTALVFNDNLLLGTSSGVYYQAWKDYYSPQEKGDFQLMKGTNGQVWKIQKTDNKLFLGHHRGAYIQSRGKLKRLETDLGGWITIPLAQNPNYYLVGHYNGLTLYKTTPDGWEYVRELDGIDDSCRILEQDDAYNIWVSHPYRGIYKISLSEDLSENETTFYDHNHGLPSNNLNHVFNINGELVFTGETGIYAYDAASDGFVPHTEFASLFDTEETILRFFEDGERNIWFVTTKEVGILQLEEKGISKHYIKKTYPEINDRLVRGFELIYPYDSKNVIIGTEKGFIHFDPTRTHAASTHLNTSIVKVESLNSNKTLIWGQKAQHLVADTTFNHKNNAFRFSFTTPHFQSDGKLQYATFLEGYDEKWSAWSSRTDKEFNNLHSGNYRFVVKSRSIDGIENEEASFGFKIAAPWYYSTKAFIFYGILFLSFLAGLILLPQRRFHEERTQLKAEYQEEVARSERKIIALENKQLQVEIAHKNKELALSAMHLVQRKKLLKQLENKLQIIIKNTNDDDTCKELKRILRMLANSAQNDDTWDQFAHYFDQVHVDFIKNLKEKYPSLTANDQKICAYLKMNLSTKEITSLMNISVRGVEMARYRLRKKLNIDSAVNLYDFLSTM